jgi:hypothetical protein
MSTWKLSPKKESQIISYADNNVRIFGRIAFSSLFVFCASYLTLINLIASSGAMDMVRIILAKTRDEEKEGEWPQFYCTVEEYKTEEGRKEVEQRIHQLFNEVRDNNPLVFDEFEKISVGSIQIAEVVVELQDYRLVADEDKQSQWDLMGTAYEEYTSAYLVQLLYNLKMQIFHLNQTNHISSSS